MSNQVAVVTGAGSGIGAAIAHELFSRGYTVVVSDIDLKSAQKVASELKGAAAEQLDVTNPAELMFGFQMPEFQRCKSL